MRIGWHLAVEGRGDHGCSKTDVERRAIIYQYMPVSELRRRGWLRPSRSVSELAEDADAFWGTGGSQPHLIDAATAPLFRKSTSCTTYRKAFVLAWLHMARRCAAEVAAGVKFVMLAHFAKADRYVRRDDVLRCARTLNVSPAIVAGALEHYRKLPYRNLVDLKPSVLPLIPGSAYLEASVAPYASLDKM